MIGQSERPQPINVKKLFSSLIHNTFDTVREFGSFAALKMCCIVYVGLLGESLKGESEVLEGEYTQFWGFWEP